MLEIHLQRDKLKQNEWEIRNLELRIEKSKNDWKRVELKELLYLICWKILGRLQ